MVLFNYSTKELTAKVVYYGPGLCGKTTNLQWIHEKLPIRNKGKMLSLATETDRTLFFDFLPIELGTIRGMKTRIQLYTVPGQVFYNATRRMVLKGADCVVFVCDSQEPMVDANLESLENLKQNLEANELDTDEMPIVLQYNKRDLPNALPIEILNERINPKGWLFFEAVAIKGIGVEETLKGVTQLVFRSLATKYGGADQSAAQAPAVAAPPPPAPKPAAPPAPVAPPPPPKPPASTLPPLNVEPAPEAADELLDSLELQPAPEHEELPEAELGLEEPAADPIEVIETLDVEEEEIAAEPPPPEPVGRTTLVSGPRETEELRRKISRPSVPDLSLGDFADDEDEQEEEIEELSLDAPHEPEPEPPPPPPVSPKPAAPPQRPARQHSAPRAATTTPTVDAPPVSIQLPGTPPAGTDITIPVEVRLGDGAAQVAIHIRLTLSLKLTQ